MENLILKIKYSADKTRQLREEIKNLFLMKINIDEASLKAEELPDSALFIIFELYDKIFFQDQIIELYSKTGFDKLNFRFSRRMSGSAGITVIPKLVTIDKCIEIAISRNHMHCFELSGRDKEVGGILVNTAFDALLLVFEHELCHLIEYMLFGKTNCKQKTFKVLAYNYFGHIKSTHLLPAHKEINLNKYDFRPGDKVKFIYQEKNYKGIISKINKQATVMCLDSKGIYIGTDKKRYSKFYVPMDMLNK
ncbi:MAG: hypothetical protein K0S55_83 [Clostridia bacterium]|nr:hypothetical protein [Clostridia bacterium]